MAEKRYSSPIIAKEMQRVHGDKAAKPAKIDMRYEGEARRFVAKLQEIHNTTPNNKEVYK